MGRWMDRQTYGRYGQAEGQADGWIYVWADRPINRLILLNPQTWALHVCSYMIQQVNSTVKV